MRLILLLAACALLAEPAVAQTTTTVQGPISVMGEKGDQGPPGPKGNMARGTPPKGSTCTDGDSFYDYDNPTAPKQRYTWTCSAGGKWFQDKSSVAVSPW